MPTATNGGVSLFYERDGRDGGESVVFVTEAGLGGWLWGWQHAALAGPHETVVWDLRATGRSDVPEGPYSMSTLVSDLLSVLDDCGLRTAHLVGCGLGSAIALSAAHRSNRVETLSLFAGAATAEGFDLEGLFAPPDDREALRAATERAFSPAFSREQPDVLSGIVDWRLAGDATREGCAAQLGALSGFDATDWLVEVTQPTLVGAGGADRFVDPAASRDLADGLPRGEFVAWEEAGHFPFVERSRSVNDRLAGVLADQG